MAQTLKKIPVWLDCDPGHDDAFAILLAACHPGAFLLGISTVHGNASIDHTTENARSILTAIGELDIPVYKGAKQPLVRPAVHADQIHGKSGLDGTYLLPRPATPVITAVSAVEAMAEALLATPAGTAWLVATGTLTNIASLFTAYPNIVQHIKGLSIMGGAIGGGFTNAPMGKVGDTERFGNWTPYAEFNIVCDPEAAAQIFNNAELAAKITLIPLDVSHQVLATKEIRNLLRFGKVDEAPLKDNTPSKLRIMLVELLYFFAETYANVFGLVDGPPLHDPIAMAAIFEGTEYAIPLYDYQPGHEGRRERYHVEVITAGSIEEALAGESQTGRTVATLLEPGQDGVKIPRGLDVHNFWKILLDCVEIADKRNVGEAVPRSDLQDASTLLATDPVGQALPAPARETPRITSCVSSTGMPPKFNNAVAYVEKIKSRYLGTPGVYRKFLDILQQYQKENMSISQIYSQIEELFHNAPDLMEEFRVFLPPASTLIEVEALAAA